MRRDGPLGSCGDAAEDGVALIAVLLAMTLLLALAGGVMQVTVTESRIAAHHRDRAQMIYATEAIVERLRADLRGADDIDGLLTGPVMSSFVDGAPGGSRAIHGLTIDLTDLTNAELCGRVTACSDVAMRAVTPERPWGANNPRWRLFAHGWLRDALGLPVAAPIYAVAWIGDDPTETDGNPLRDSPGQRRIALRVRAYGPQGAQLDVDAILADVPRRPQVVTWVER
jgi:hypothetical protein